MVVTDRRFGLGVLTLAFVLGFSLMTQSMQIMYENHNDESDTTLINNQKISQVNVYELRLGVITDKTEYKRGEVISSECVVINDFPYAVTIKPPSNFGATSYSKADPDNKMSQAISVTWVESEIELPPNSTVVLTRFHFSCDEIGGFVIYIHGFPETEVLVGIPHAWILGGRTGGGSGPISR